MIISRASEDTTREIKVLCYGHMTSYPHLSKPKSPDSQPDSLQEGLQTPKAFITILHLGVESLKPRLASTWRGCNNVLSGDLYRTYPAVAKPSKLPIICSPLSYVH